LRKAELGYLTGLVYFLGSLSWLTTVTGPGWFILCLYLALYPAVWAGLVYVIATPREDPFSFRSVWLSSWRNLATGLTAAAAWVALEFLRGHVFTGFGWNALGVALHANVPLLQLASLTGVGGLSFLAVLTAAIAVATVRRLMLEARGGRIRAHFDFTLTIALVVAAFGYGLRQLGDPGPGTTVRVAAVQPSIPQNQKWNPAFEQRIYDTLARLTDHALAMDPQLLLWPEAATPRGFFEDPVANRFVKDYAGRGDHALLLGTLILSHEADHNAAVLFAGPGTEPQVYPKSHLVMFGEYVPFRESFPLFAIIVGDLVPADFDAGAWPWRRSSASRTPSATSDAPQPTRARSFSSISPMTAGSSAAPAPASTRPMPCSAARKTADPWSAAPTPASPALSTTSAASSKPCKARTATLSARASSSPKSASRTIRPPRSTCGSESSSPSSASSPPSPPWPAPFSAAGRLPKPPPRASFSPA
jgi:apolipoprotein N-acyltransferase